jgi:hypothetical protein
MIQKKPNMNTKQDLKLNIKNKELLDKKPIIKPYRYGDYLSKFSIQHWKEKFKFEFQKRKLYLVIFQLRNGKYDMFTIATNKPYFIYREGEYYIDSDLVREDVNTGLNVLYYHQDCSMPFKITFNLDELLTDVKNENIGVEKAINPYSLKNFINSQVIEKVLKGQELTDDMKFLKMLVIINILVSGVAVVLMGRAMGWF